jgi:hypothetical protein
MKAEHEEPEIPVATPCPPSPPSGPWPELAVTGLVEVTDLPIGAKHQANLDPIGEERENPRQPSAPPRIRSF